MSDRESITMNCPACGSDSEVVKGVPNWICSFCGLMLLCHWDVHYTGLSYSGEMKEMMVSMTPDFRLQKEE